MPGYSVGTVPGAAIGAALVALQWPSRRTFSPSRRGARRGPASALRGFLPHAALPSGAVATERPRGVAEPRTVLIGVFVLCMAFSEGTGNDWLGLGVIDGYHASPRSARWRWPIFLAAMTLGRWFGPGMLDRFGRVTVLRRARSCRRCSG